MAYDINALVRSVEKAASFAASIRRSALTDVLRVQRSFELSGSTLAIAETTQRSALLSPHLTPKLIEAHSVLFEPRVHSALTEVSNLTSLALAAPGLSRLSIASDSILNTVERLSGWPKLQLSFHSLADANIDLWVRLSEKADLVGEPFERALELLSSDMRIKTAFAATLSEPFVGIADLDCDDADQVFVKIRVRLAARKPDYAFVLDEAYEAYSDSARGQGRARLIHLIFRELCMQIIDDLAPASEVRGFTTDPTAFLPDGRPKRHVQLAYICRAVSGVGMASYVAESRRLTKELIRKTNKVVHARRLDVAEQQVRLLVLDGADVVDFLLDMAEAGGTVH